MTVLIHIIAKLPNTITGYHYLENKEITSKEIKKNKFCK